jgi:large subunit ribosomal protein L24
MNKVHVKRNDLVMVINGKDKGKTGKVLSVFPQTGRAIVEGINLMKKHTRRTREDQQGGIIQKEASLSISNLMLYCNRCHKATRTSVNILKDGSKNRVCRLCREVIA